HAPGREACPRRRTPLARPPFPELPPVLSISHERERKGGPLRCHSAGHRPPPPNLLLRIAEQTSPLRSAAANGGAPAPGPPPRRALRPAHPRSTLHVRKPEPHCARRPGHHRPKPRPRLALRLRRNHR